MSKASVLNKELKELSLQDLSIKVDMLQRELFSLRLHAATSPIKDKTQFRKLRKDIARTLTQLRLKELEVAK
jgi:ribosomal protein L29